jgi:hypothetical protein
VIYLIFKFIKASGLIESTSVLILEHDRAFFSRLLGNTPEYRTAIRLSHVLGFVPQPNLRILGNMPDERLKTKPAPAGFLFIQTLIVNQPHRAEA